MRSSCEERIIPKAGSTSSKAGALSPCARNLTGTDTGGRTCMAITGGSFTRVSLTDERG
jgi:hypothetical protein